MVLSFVDRDMVMRYFGGGIGHLSNSIWKFKSLYVAVRSSGSACIAVD